MRKFLNKSIDSLLLTGAFLKVLTKKQQPDPAKESLDILSSSENDKISSKDELHDFINQRRAANSVPFPVPKELDSYQVEILDDGPLRTFIWNQKNNASQRVIFYLHGGSYFKQPKSHYFNFLNQLAKNLSAKIVMPIYPKGPQYNFTDSQDRLLNLYKDLLQEVDSASKITLMGDSAGGGMAMGLADSLVEAGLNQPKDLILISPWLDIATNNPMIEAFQEVDPSLVQWQLQEYGNIWAGGNDNYLNPFVSPLYSQQLDDIARISILVGSHEIFYPDNELLHEKLLKLEILHNFIVGRGSHHIFPVKDEDKGPEATEIIERIISNDISDMDTII